MRDLKVTALLVVATGLVAIGLFVFSTSDSSEDGPGMASAEALDSSTVPSTRSSETSTSTTTTTTTSTTTTEAPPIRSDQLFVSPDGVDRPDGGWTRDDPLQTPNYAVSVSMQGDTINLLPGRYETVTVSGRTGLAITAPDGGATLSSGTYDEGAAVLIEDSASIVIEGIRTERSLWGIRVFNSTDVVLSKNGVIDTGQEAIHVLSRSKNVRIEGNRVDGTGRRPGGNGEFQYADFGEGIYLGTGGFLDGGAFDDVSNVQVIGNEISNTTAEAIEVKTSVYNVVVQGNIIHDVDVHSGAAISIGRGERIYDANVLVDGNAVWNVTTRNPWADGVGVRVSSPAIVRNNVIFNVEHFGIRVDEELRNVSGEVVVDNNLIFSSGLEAYVDESGGTGVPVTMTGTIAGDAALALLEDLGQSVDEPAVAELLQHVGARS